MINYRFAHPLQRLRTGRYPQAVRAAMVALFLALAGAGLWLLLQPRLTMSQEGCLAQGCHPTKGSGPGLHLAMEQGCETCHQVKGPHETDKSQVVLTGKGNDLCFQCHDNPATKAHKHDALASGCISCHDPHRSVNKHLLKQLQPELCYQCHDHKTKGHYVHSAITQLGCTGCHQPHSAAQKNLLNDPPPKLCSECHEAKNAGPVVHPAVAQGCNVCHDYHSSNQPQLLLSPAGELCGQCHRADTGARKIHSALKQGLCLGCHDPHQSKNKKLIKGAKLEDDCIGCHQSKKPAKAIVHPALTDAGCPSCHLPHKSEFNNLLTKKEPGLCYECHERKDTGPVVHAPLLYGRCSGCHEPHQSDTKGMLQGKDLAGTCFSCHYNDITGRKVVHPPVQEGACRDCHLPHASKFDKLLTADSVNLCFNCHPAFPKVKNPHQALERKGCATCHNPHGSDYEKMLIKPVNEVCITCHPKQAAGAHVARGFGSGQHPLGGVPDRSRPGREMSCASCHNPHGSDNPQLFYRESNKVEVCQKCHKKK